LARLGRPWLTTHFESPPWAFALLFQFIPWLVLFYGLLKPTVILKNTPSHDA